MKKPLHWVAAAAAVVLVPLVSVDSASAVSTFDIVGTPQTYTLQADFNPNWTAVPQGFVERAVLYARAKTVRWEVLAQMSIFFIVPLPLPPTLQRR